MSSEESAEAWLETADGQRWPLNANCPIGRSPSNVIVVSDRKVSRRHAVVHRQNVSEFWLVDLGSANGSYINELRVSLPQRLNNGDVMKLGDFALVFHQPTPADDETEDDSNSQLSSLTFVDVKSTDCWMLLADIEGSTTLATKHTPADWAHLVGRWAGSCRQIVDLHGGSINKYLGDGFLAIWPAKDHKADHITGALKGLFELQKADSPPFRLVLHKGEVFTGGGGLHGEDNLSGLELVMLFRMEKLAGSLKTSFLCSTAVQEVLGDALALEHAGSHEVAGFTDDDRREFYCLHRS